MVNGTQSVTRPLCRGPGWAACLQRGLWRCCWPFKRSQPCAAVSQWVQLVLLPFCPPPLPLPRLCGHVLGTRIACDGALLVFTTHTHTHTAQRLCVANLDVRTQTRLRWGPISWRRMKPVLAPCVPPTWWRDAHADEVTCDTSAADLASGLTR